MRRPDTIRALAGASLLALGLGLSGGASAQSLACGEPYTVARGDSLSGIAKRVYGEASGFQIIYSANSGAIGPNPALIRVGMTLDIPCLDETTASTADPSAIREKETTDALPAPDDRQIRVVTASDWAPFSDESQEQGGMMTEVMNVALAASDYKPRYKIDFINDWGAHLQPLLSDHAYDFGMPWFKPNCDVVEKLGPGSQFRCNNLAWSEPLFEQVIGYYTRATDPAYTEHAQLFGKTVCRPAGYSTYMLEENDLVEPNVTLRRPAGPAEMFTDLVNGDCDVAVIATETANDALAKLDIAPKVVAHEPLGTVATLHAVISRTHPRRDEYLEILNNGILKIKADQRWFEIVRRHLAEHKARMATGS